MQPSNSDHAEGGCAWAHFRFGISECPTLHIIMMLRGDSEIRIRKSKIGLIPKLFVPVGNKSEIKNISIYC